VTRPRKRHVVLVPDERAERGYRRYHDTGQDAARQTLDDMVLRGLVLATDYPEDAFASAHVDDIVHALQRCGGWTKPGAVAEFRAWHAGQRRGREMCMATADGLRQRWRAYYRSRHDRRDRYRALRRRLVIAIVEVKRLARGIVYFGDNFAAGRVKGRTIAVCFIGYYVLQALRSADERQGVKLRTGLGGADNLAIDVLREWLALVLKIPPGHDTLARMLSPSRTG
jgi:hypothetical protein